MGEREESCNSRHFSRLIKSCFPNPNDTTPSIIIPPIPISTITKHHCTTIISSLPDDLLIDILSRIPLSSLPSLSAVCRRWFHLLDSPFFLLLRRRRHHLLHPTLFAFSLSSYSAAAVSTLRPLLDSSWNHFIFSSHIDLSHARFVPIGRKLYIIGRFSSSIYDPWTGSVRSGSGPLFPRKRFAAAAVSCRIYVAGGSARVSAVEEYDPDCDTWRVVIDAPRRRYGCIGVGIAGVFYVIGGLKVGGASDSLTNTGCTSDSRAIAGAETRAYASSMDLYDVAARGWLRSRSVPGGGCVVAACGALGHVYVVASHAVELSFWRFNATRKNVSGNIKDGSGGSGLHNGGGRFGKWCRMRSPPLPPQVRLDGTVRFSCVGVQDKVVLIQVMGCINDLMRRSGRNMRGCKEGLVLMFDCITEEWSRGPDLPQVVQRPTCVCVEC